MTSIQFKKERLIQKIKENKETISITTGLITTVSYSLLANPTYLSVKAVGQTMIATPIAYPIWLKIIFGICFGYFTYLFFKWIINSIK